MSADLERRIGRVEDRQDNHDRRLGKLEVSMAETHAWRVEHDRHHERTDLRHARTPNLAISIIIAAIAAAGLIANLLLARGGP